MSARASVLRSRMRSRTTTVLVVVAAHGRVLWALWRERAPPPDEPEAFTSVRFFLPERSNNTLSPSRPEAARVARPTTSRAQLPLITLPSNPAATVDCHAQIPDAADSELDNERRALRQRSALTRKFVVPDDARNPHPHPASSFRWYEAGIHRIDTRGPIPALRLNDHCLLAAFVIPFCVIGHIEIHGDLFDHMAEEQDDKAGTVRPNDVP